MTGGKCRGAAGLYQRFFRKDQAIWITVVRQISEKVLWSNRFFLNPPVDCVYRAWLQVAR